MRRAILAVAALAATAPAAEAATYDPRIVHVMVNQGVQEFTTHGTPQTSGSRRVATYNGVTLQEGRKTVVKVYANFAQSVGTVTGFGARLTVRRQTSTGLTTLGTLVQDYPQQAVGPGSFDGVSLNQVRNNTTGVFTFTLPQQWTGVSDGDGDGRYENTAAYRLSLLAQLIPPNDNSALQKCVTSTCLANDLLQVDNVTFVSVCCPDIPTVKVIGRNPITGVYYPEPRPVRTALDPGLRLIPVDIAVSDFRVTLDISNSLQRDYEAFPNGYIDENGNQSPIPCCYGARIGELLDKIKADRFPNAYGIFGFYSKDMVGGQGRPGTAWTNDDANRPLTNIAHEFGHALGRNHFSPACKGGTPSDPSEPDGIGLIQGIGILMDTGTPYKMTLSPSGIPSSPGVVPSDGAGVYDLMSYCAPQGITNETNGRTWLSVYGWQDLVTRFRYTGATATAAQAPPPPGLAVYADVAPNGTVRVRSALPGRTPANLEPSDYRLVVRDAAGAVISDVALGRRTSTGHSPGGGVSVGLAGAAPIDPALARRVEVTHGGALVAALDRSASAPTASFLSPAKGDRIGRGEKVDIRWQAADADGGDLEITVEWSREGGRTGTWRPVFLGPNGGSVTLPSHYFAGSGDAQLRLRVNDGFNETVALSEKFKAVSHPPRVDIVEPRAGQRFRRGARVHLRALAFDERAQSLGDKNVVWNKGRRRLGTGAAVTIRKLRRGRHTLRVTATDPLTRKKDTDRVRIRVR